MHKEVEDSTLSDDPRLGAFHDQVKQELERLLAFWTDHRMLDEAHGGFVGRIDSSGQKVKGANKAVILHTRLLWTFSAVANQTGSRSSREMADRAFGYLQKYFRDTRCGGVYWMLTEKGEVLEGKKQVYAQAFAIYGLVEYFRLTAQTDALDWALEIFDLLEQYSLDPDRGGYLEAFDRQWRLLEDMRLSEIDANEAKTMNTHLHLIEAFTNLHRTHPHPRSQEALGRIIRTYRRHFIQADTGHLHLFFDEHWNLKSSEVSFGHDIESAWLLQEAAEVLGEEILIEEMKHLAVRIADVTLAEGMSAKGGLMNERLADGTHQDERVWWVQAEALVGFVNAYQVTREDKYLNTALGIWSFIRSKMLDVEGGEWWWSVYANGAVNLEADKVGPWKGPYHNVRACLEMLSRLVIF